MKADLESIIATLKLMMLAAAVYFCASVLMGCGAVPTEPKLCPLFADTLGVSRANIDSLNAKNHRMGCPDAF